MGSDKKSRSEQFIPRLEYTLEVSCRHVDLLLHEEEAQGQEVLGRCG